MKQIVAAILLIASITISVIWHLNLVSDRVLTLAIAAIGLTSIVTLEIPFLITKRRKK
jgi:hypothetical protein